MSSDGECLNNCNWLERTGDGVERLSKVNDETILTEKIESILDEVWHCKCGVTMMMRTVIDCCQSELIA
jgi:hypothetical protein